MPEGIGYGEDAIQRLIELATDPMYDEADPLTVGALQQGVPQPGGASPTMDYRINPSYAEGGLINPSYAEGGLVTPNGAPQQAGLATQGNAASPATMQQMEAEMQRMVQQNPEMILKIKTILETGLQSGEISPQELNMAAQLATAAAQNPQLYPQLRSFAIQQGLADEQGLPMEYDQGLVFVILLAVRAVQMQGQPPMGQPPMGGIPQSQGQPPQASMKMGGLIPNSPNADGSVAINAHKGEYMIPDDVVRKKGTDFFDKMIGKDGKATA